MSEYEESQVLTLIEEIDRQCGSGLDKDEVHASCWLAYLEMKDVQYDCASPGFWPKAADHMVRAVSQMRSVRNSRFALESRLSLNQSSGYFDEELGSSLLARPGDFTSGIELWNHAKSLGETKYRIMRYLSEGEEDSYIMQKMELPEPLYRKLLAEIREDMKDYREK